LRVGLPEVNSRPQPIVVIAAYLKGFAGEHSLSDFTTTSMIAEQEARC
jgi:hypothetical protein